MPEFPLEDVEDYFTYYVEIIGISEELFWYADMSFLIGVVENKAAYDGWFSYIQKKEAGAHGS